MYPDTDKPPMVLSKRKKVYYSATFVKVRGNEYLAAAKRKDGCLYLWDIGSKTLKKVFDPKLPSEQTHKRMVICKIDESTIGYGEVNSSSDGSRRVFVLNTDSEQFTFTSTLRLTTPSNIWDMCYTEVDSSACLLLCIPIDNRVMAMEMVGGKTRWEVGKKQMGEQFKPWSICVDQNDTVYVADFRRMIHLLSAADGSVIKQINGTNYGITNIFTVRFHDEHLFIEHTPNSPREKYAISKFKEIDGHQ